MIASTLGAVARWQHSPGVFAVSSRQSLQAEHESVQAQLASKTAEHSSAVATIHQLEQQLQTTTQSLQDTTAAKEVLANDLAAVQQQHEEVHLCRCSSLPYACVIAVHSRVHHTGTEYD